MISRPFAVFRKNVFHEGDLHAINEKYVPTPPRLEKRSRTCKQPDFSRKLHFAATCDFQQQEIFLIFAFHELLKYRKRLYFRSNFGENTNFLIRLISKIIVRD